MDIKNRKGFLFVITIFLILTYILLSISIWVKAIEASERAYSELYKESTIELTIDQLTPAKISNISNTVMYRGLFVLNRHSVDHTLKEGDTDEYEHIESAMSEYLKDGSPAEEHFVDGVAPESEYNSSLAGWMANLNSSLTAIGAYIEDFEIYDFTFEQTAVNTLDYSFNMRIYLRDISGTTSIDRTYPVEGELDITGFVDPAIVRETKDDEAVYRQFFFHTEEYANPSDLSPDKIDSIDAGQGWFYGPLVGVSGAAAMDSEHRHRYIVVGDYSGVSSLPEDTLNAFGGIILTNEPGVVEDTCSDLTGDYDDETDTLNAITYTLEGGDCEAEIDGDTETNKPFVVVPGFSLTDPDLPDCPDFIRGSSEKCVLFIAEHHPDHILDGNYRDKFDTTEYTGVYDVENIRDYTLCGYYVPNINSPSYLQRLLNDSYSRNSEFGIETFLIGEYIGPDYDDYDRLDKELLNGTLKEDFIRGMPGCKDFEMCDNSGTITGRFGLSTGTIGEYDVDDIDCGDGAGCET